MVNFPGHYYLKSTGNILYRDSIPKLKHRQGREERARIVGRNERSFQYVHIVSHQLVPVGLKEFLGETVKVKGAVSIIDVFQTSILYFCSYV